MLKFEGFDFNTFNAQQGVRDYDLHRRATKKAARKRSAKCQLLKRITYKPMELKYGYLIKNNTPEACS